MGNQWAQSAFRRDPLTTFNVRIPRSLAEQIRRHCRETGEGISAYARRTLPQGLPQAELQDAENTGEVAA